MRAIQISAFGPDGLLWQSFQNHSPILLGFSLGDGVTHKHVTITGFQYVGPNLWVLNGEIAPTENFVRQYGNGVSAYPFHVNYRPIENTWDELNIFAKAGIAMEEHVACDLLAS